MKLRATIELKECPGCRRSKNRSGRPLRHHAKGLCKACYMKKLRKATKR